MLKLILSFSLFFLMASLSYSQDVIEGLLEEIDQHIEEYVPAPENADEYAEEAAAEVYEDVGDPYMSPAHYRIQLIKGIFVATPVLLIICLGFLKMVTGSSAHNVVNATGLILVIQATMFIVIASPSTEALTAAIGVLGAIIGYLFGANMRKPDEGEKSSPSSTPA